MTVHRSEDAPPPGRKALLVAAVVLAGSVVGVAVFLVARSVTPDYNAGLFGQHLVAAVRLKARLATALLALALVQLVLALWIYGRLPGAGAAPRRVGMVHRVVGVLLFLLSLPITIHCVQAYGIELNSTRTALHSLAGCFFYGAFVAKVLVVRSSRLPGWMLPLVGGLLVTTVAVLWYAGALWYFNGFQSPGL